MDTHDAGSLTPPNDGQAIRLSWQHPTGLVGLSFINLLLMIATLGIYGFWARTEVRKRIWSAVRIEGEPLHYTGTGKELFVGFFIAFFLVFLPIVLSPLVVFYIFGKASIVPKLYNLGLYVALFALVGYALYRAQRYILSRTRWRAIRGALVGNAGDYALTYFWTGLLVVFTLGWALPWRSTKLQGILTRETYFGGMPFRFDARSGPLYPRFAVLWIAAVLIYSAIGVIVAALLFQKGYLGGTDAPFETGPDGKRIPDLATVGLIYGVVLVGMLVLSVFSAWYRASQLRHFFNHTHFDGATFRATFSTLGLIWVAVSNVFILIGTLGVLAPIAQARMARYMVQNLSIEGPVRVDAITQAVEQNIRSGEGLAQAFDVGGF